MKVAQAQGGPQKSNAKSSGASNPTVKSRAARLPDEVPRAASWGVERKGGPTRGALTAKSHCHKTLALLRAYS